MSSERKPFRAGRIFMGLNSRGADPLSPLREATRPSPEKEEEYMERVRTKAQHAAREIIAKAMAEAEAIKHEAHNLGYEQGMATASQELDHYRQTLSQKLGDLIKGLRAEKDTLRARQCKDMALLLKAALEKVLAAELEADRTRILEHLLDEALVRIDSRECVTISCSPEDKSFLDELLTQTGQKFPDLEKWVIKASPTMEKGGLKIESCNGMVDNSIASRYALVREIIEQISLEDEQ